MNLYLEKNLEQKPSLPNSIAWIANVIESSQVHSILILYFSNCFKKIISCLFGNKYFAFMISASLFYITVI